MQEANYHQWQANVQLQEERHYEVSKIIAAVASRMKESETWGIVTLAAPFVMKANGQVPVKIFTKKGNFISYIPVEVFVKSKGTCLEDGDTFSFPFHGKTMELVVCNAYKEPSFKAHITKVIKHSVHGTGFPPERANDLLEGKPYPGAVRHSSLSHGPGL